MASSMSRPPASAQTPMTCSVTGLTLSRALPPSADRSTPPIYSRSSTNGSIWSAMFFGPSCSADPARGRSSRSPSSAKACQSVAGDGHGEVENGHSSRRGCDETDDHVHGASRINPGVGGSGLAALRPAHCRDDGRVPVDLHGVGRLLMVLAPAFPETQHSGLLVGDRDERAVAGVAGDLPTGPGDSAFLDEESRTFERDV